MYWKKASLFITTDKAVEILGVKYRRARAVLLSMVESGWLKKEGVSRSTIYVKCGREIRWHGHRQNNAIFPQFVEDSRL